MLLSNEKAESYLFIHLSGAVLTTSGGLLLSSLLHKVDFRVSICTLRLKRNPIIYN